MKENKRRRHILSCCQAGLRTSVDNNKKQNLFSGGGEEGGGGGHSSNLIYVKYLLAGNSVDTRLVSVISFFPPLSQLHPPRFFPLRLKMKTYLCPSTPSSPLASTLEFPSLTPCIIAPQQCHHYSLNLILI